MLSLTEIKPGKKIIVSGDPFVVVAAQHSKMGRAGAVLRTKMRNLLSGAVISKTFQGSDSFEEAQIESQAAQYLYKEGENFCFMNSESYEQFELSDKVIGENAGYLKEGTELDILYFNGNPVNIELPIKIDLEVTEAPPAIKGNTADGGSKEVALETGIKITTPLFIKEGDKIKVNTQTGEYVSKA